MAKCENCLEATSNTMKARDDWLEALWERDKARSSLRRARWAAYVFAVLLIGTLALLATGCRVVGCVAKCVAIEMVVESDGESEEVQ